MKRVLRGVRVVFSVVGGMGIVAACSTNQHDFSKGKGGTSGTGGGDEPEAVGGANGGTDSVESTAGAGGTGSDDCSPGTTERCYEDADGTPYEGKPPADQTTCRYGERKCGGDGTWGVCLGAVAPEAKDLCDPPGNDADCNGLPNEGCSCEDGDTRACGSDKGNCKQGTQTCKDKAWGACEGEIKQAAVDSCEPGDDANCNDIPNEGCSCVNGTSKPCGTDIGPCEFGTVTCVNGVYPATCKGGVAPAAADTCEPGNDANCNDTANEGCTCTGDTQVECGNDTGACTKGKQTCSGGVLGMCTGGVQPTTNDTCLAADEANDTNCNGQFRDGCECVGTDPAGNCGDAGCGSRTCNGATGKWGACTGDGTTLRCNPSSPDARQVCGANGAWVASACPAGSVCREDGEACKKVDGQTCATSSECDTGSCGSFYVDADGDGYRANATIAKFCGATKQGYVTAASNKGDDCKDDSGAVNPGEGEVCDGIDNNCDNLIDMAETAAGLKLSGTAKVIESGTDSSVGASNGVYGIALDANKPYFTTLNQNNTIALARKELDTTAMTGTAVTWNGSEFGVFYRAYGGNVFFRRVTPAGAFTPASPVIVGNQGTGALDAGAAYMAGQGYFYVGWSVYASGQWGFGYGLSTTDVPTPYMALTNPGKYVDVAASGNRFGVVWNEGQSGATGTQTLKLSLRDGTGTETNVTTLGNTTSEKKATIAARSGGGFAVMWNESTTIKYQEVSATGASLCGPISRTYTDFLPDQMVPTKRGFLAVSGNNKVVKLQEVLSGCTWGGNFPNIGTGTETGIAHIAAGPNGFAVVWDEKHGSSVPMNIYSRTFGPNLCD